MTSLEYYIESIEQFISALTDDIESGESKKATQGEAENEFVNVPDEVAEDLPFN